MTTAGADASTFPTLPPDAFGRGSGVTGFAMVDIREPLSGGRDALSSIRAHIERGDAALVFDPEATFLPFGVAHAGGRFVTYSDVNGRGNFATLDAALKAGLTARVPPLPYPTRAERRRARTAFRRLAGAL